MMHIASHSIVKSTLQYAQGNTSAYNVLPIWCVNVKRARWYQQNQYVRHYTRLIELC